MEKDRFLELFEMQKELIRTIFVRTGDTGTVHGSITAMMVEAGEFLNENGQYKWWKKNHLVDTEKELEEFIDIFFFWLQAAILKGYTADQLFDAYKRKWKVNIERQKSNY